MNNYRFKIQYDGTRYHGWQRQKNGSDTIQGRIEQVLSRQMGHPVEIDGAGRTDAGVHAREQVANVHLDYNGTTEELRECLNEYLPEDIRILEVEIAGERFHSRLNATGKVYEYRLCKKGCFDVFARKYQWQMEELLDVARMKEAAGLLLGEHDFKGFCTKASRKKSTIRRIDAIDIEETENAVILHFFGNGFLYNMVRILTGTLVEIGTGTREISTIEEIFERKERVLAGMTAPAKGLTLVRVKYD
ncbi:MAG: tRNA pseudouridine(38-40) synthase TruA [Eubacterium sp.]|nr:tRNA pseudouridine(38-40) synthase TruA [Eubacterium sp.]